MDINKQLFDSFEIDEKHLPATGTDEDRFRAVRQVLAQRIDELIRTDFEKLKWILYRIDINEKKLAEALKVSERDAAEVIADMIITRQIEKAESRKKFNESDTADWSFDL